MYRTIDTATVTPVIAQLAQKACYELDENVLSAIKDGINKEVSPYGRDVLEMLIHNAEYAKQEQIACCHDTGVCVVWMEIGQEVSWTGRPLYEAVHEGVRKGYTQGYLRTSMVKDPLDRVNTGDNTPAVIHAEIVDGDRVTITVLPKGGGSENMGAFSALVPDLGEEGVKNFVLETVKRSGGKACPPLTVGVGIGGTMDACAVMAKKALLRPIGLRNSSPSYARIEEELLSEINALGIGPLGMGGRVTALDVHIEWMPCHITSLPVAVNLQCHANRRASAQI